MSTVAISRLTGDDVELARVTFALMAAVFDEGAEPLDDAHLRGLLASPTFWGYAAAIDGAVVGGITAHALPMTRSPSWEIFIYDLAVRSDHQRRGIGADLVGRLRQDAAIAGITDVFVPADNDDAHALAFYAALGGDPAAVTIFTFGA